MAGIKPPKTPYLDQLQDTGFVIVKAVLTTTEVDQLRKACGLSTSQARNGQWPFIRTLPKQFPPWPSTPPPEGIWGVQHLMHPSQPCRDLFISSYFNPKLLAVVEEILGARSQASANGPTNGNTSLRATNDVTSSEGSLGGEPLVLELYNLLVRPDSHFELRWHRDDIPPTATRAEEEAALSIANGSSKPVTYSHTQWNLALHPDRSLIVVPGTHKRARTDAERDAGPYDKLDGQLEVELEPGDVVFYDNDILHRGRYDPTKERATLHGSVGKRGFAEKRARNVLQHGVGEWIGQCGFEGLDAEARRRAEGMKENLLAMGSASGNTGFSQAD